MVGKKLQSFIVHCRPGRLGILAVVALTILGTLPGTVSADDAIDMPPIIGKEQRLRWNGVNTGQQDNTPLDGTIFCAAFGGPDDVPPPAGRFANNFVMMGGQFRPTSVDGNVMVSQPAINDSDRDDNWIYAFQFVNDEGDVAGEGGAIINSINLSLPPCTSGIDQSFPNPAMALPGLYVTEYGSTDLPDANVVNFFNISVPFVGIGRQFALNYAQNVLDPGDSSEIFFYYSPFGPSNRNVSINGGEGGAALAHATINQVVTAQFYPVFECVIDDIPLVELDPVVGNEIQVDVTVTNQFPSQANGGSLDTVSMNPTQVGNVLQIQMGGGTIPQHERTQISFTSPQEALDCVDFRLTSGGPPVASPLQGLLDIDKGGSQPFTFFVFVKPDYFDACGSPLQLLSALDAQSPYDDDPPFEGHTKFGMPTDPSLDADPDVNGTSCTLDVMIGRPPEVEIVKSVQFLDFTNPGNPIPLPAMPVQQVDSPPCGKVKFTITVTAPDTNQESITNFVLNDKLPAGLTFANAVEPGGVIINEMPPGSGCLSVSGIPDLASNTSFSFCFRACVDPGTPPGILTNVADVVAEGADTMLPTNNPMDDASVNVLELNMSLTNEGVNDDIICVGQNATFNFEVCNTGAHPLDVTIPAASLDAQLGLVSQNPPGGAVVTLAPGACQAITVMVQALAGGAPNDFENCVRLDPVVGHPDQVDPGNPDCDIALNAEQCIDVIDPRLAAICLDVDPPGDIAPGGMVTMTKRITNTGNVGLDPVTVDCVIDPDLDVPMGSIPADIGPLAPGESVDIMFTATASLTAAPNDVLCVTCDYVGHPVNLPGNDVSCDVQATSTCCTTIEGRQEIPTLSEWGLIALVAMFGGLLVRRRFC